MAGDARLAVADDAVADLRPHAVAADQRAAFGAFAVFQRDGDVIAVVLVAIDAPAGFQRDQIAALAGFQERAVDVGAMGDRIRLAEAFDEGAIERNVGDQFAGERVAHFLRRRAVGVGQDGVLEADLLQHAEDIGPELDAGADLAEFGRLLEHAHRKALARQRIGRDQAADAAAGHQKGRRATIRCGPWALPRARKQVFLGAILSAHDKTPHAPAHDKTPGARTQSCVPKKSPPVWPAGWIAQRSVAYFVN